MALGMLLALPTAFHFQLPPRDGPGQLTRRQALLRGLPAAAAAFSAQPALAEFLTLEKAQAQAARAQSGAVEGREPFSGDYAKQGGLGGRSFDLGASGISAYQKLQLETALSELAKPLATSSAGLKDVIEVFTSTLPRVSDASIAESEVQRLLRAADALSGLSQDNDGLKATSDSVVTQSQAFESAIKKKDTKKLAVAAIALADLLTDYAYVANQAEKPLAPLREAPLAYDPDRKRIDLPVSGKSI